MLWWAHASCWRKRSSAKMKIEKMKGGAIDWEYCYSQSCKGELLHTIQNEIPREHWKDASADRFCCGSTLLHFACSRKNLGALVFLLQNGADANAPAEGNFPPLRSAVLEDNPRAVEILCSVGADAHLKPDLASQFSPFRLSFYVYECATAFAFIANGYRIGDCSGWRSKWPPPKAFDFERGILTCRSAICALLTVKRKRGDMAHVDRFLMREIAFAIWSTRSENNDAWAQVKNRKKGY